MTRVRCWPLQVLLACGLWVLAQAQADRSTNRPTIELGRDGRLTYVACACGDRIPDFSYCGYFAGARVIPRDIPVRVYVPVAPGDNTARIQRALDYVGMLPAAQDGFRGAVLLGPGQFEIHGRLMISNSGVVLRGSGIGQTGTVLWFRGVDRTTAIRVRGTADFQLETNASWVVADAYVPVGSMQLRVHDAGGLRVGDNVFLYRPSTREWIEFLGMRELGGGEGLGWRPGSRDLVWDRTITAVSNGLVELDAPLTTALDSRFGGAFLGRYTWPGRITNVGVENMVIRSEFDPARPKDEDHVWCGVTFEHACDCWVRQVRFEHLAGSAVAIYETCRRITVSDCANLAPVSEDGGYRRHSFFTMGQQTLFLRCYAENGRHDFAAGHCAAGPNAFVQCEAVNAARHSGGIESWASGVLYDNVRIDGSGLVLGNLGGLGGRFGWCAANSVLWQCTAAYIRCQNPPGAWNWAFGCWGEFDGDGQWRSSNEFVEPDSLYEAQLRERLGPSAAAALKLVPRQGGAESNPSVERAAELTAQAREPAKSLIEHILEAAVREPLPTNVTGAVHVDSLAPDTACKHQTDQRSRRLILTNGWLVIDGKLAVGWVWRVDWWRGSVIPAEAVRHGVAITRFMPGRIGHGFTDDLNSIAERMLQQGAVALEHNHGLWYDRRRDDHQRVRRATSDVLPPFFEQPFARSGTGVAWDGLSKYDLTRFNPFYWNRLAEFASICAHRGLILFHQNYFQHNVLEAGAHWADFPWRTANNINNTGFPEPPNYAGDKRIFMAEQFYDVTHPVRRALHRSYIRQCLNAFATNSNVIQFTSAEFTGPLHFMQFWLDVVAEWQRETGHDPLIALSATKDVQDAVLADSERRRIVDIVDFRYWWRTAKGEFAPPGGKNLAPRQFERQWRGGRPTDADLASMAAEYKAKFPELAVIADFDTAGWAWLCAGGSLPRLPQGTDPELLEFVPTTRPVLIPTASTNLFALTNGRGSYLVDLAGAQGPVTIRLPPNASGALLKWIDPRTGRVVHNESAQPVNGRVSIDPGDHPRILWIVCR